MNQPSEKRKEMQARREKVMQLLETKSETEISTILGVSRETIVRDVAAIKKSLYSWTDDLPKFSFIHKYKLALQRSITRRNMLENLLTKATDIFETLSIIKEIRSEEMWGTGLLDKAPTVYGLRRAVRERDVQTS